MDIVLLSRLQFAVATVFHFLFVPLSLGLVLIIAITETIYVRTGDEEYKRMAKFWGKIFLVNFVVGVVTGLTLEFQFGTNWAGYAKYVGDVFGSILAIEATTSFTIESTFIGIWFFGWKRLSPKAHAVCIWVVAVAAYMSAYWILVANSWMQHPVGYVIRNARAELVDFLQIITQPFAILAILHVTFAAVIVGSFFVMGVSSYHILRKQNVSFFTKSFRIAVVLALIFSITEIVVGDFHGKMMAKTQPTKLAAAESQWETMKGAPFYLLVIPDPSQERNLVQMFGIPKMLSWLAHDHWDAEFKGLKSWPEKDRPPVLPVFTAFRSMVGLGFLFALVSIVAFWKRNRLEESPRLLRVLVLMIPLPYLAAELGWMVTELGRQPWIVYDMLRTADAHSPLATHQVAISLTAFVVVYSLIGLVCFYLIARFAHRGPEPLPGEAA